MYVFFISDKIKIGIFSYFDSSKMSVIYNILRKAVFVREHDLGRH